MKRSLKAVICMMIIVTIHMPVFANGTQESGGDGVVELNFLEVMTSPSRTNLLKELISEFESTHPGIRINLISPPYEQADNRLTLGLNTEEDLDIVEVRDYTVKQFVNNGKLTSLEPFLDQWSESDTLLPITLQAARTVDDIAYLIPQFLFVKGLFVRTDILQEAGITEYPQTIDELIDMSIAITDPERGQYGFGFRGKGSEFKFSDYITLSNLNSINPDNLYQTRSGAFSLTQPLAEEYLRRYVELYHAAVPNDGINWGFNEQVNGFVSGATPFLIQDPDTVGVIADQLRPDQYTVIPLPLGRSGKAYLDYGFAGLGVPSYSAHKEEAMQFLAFMLSAETNARFAKGYGALPIHADTYEEDEYFSSGVYTAWVTMMDNNPHYQFVGYPLSSPKWPGWDQVHTQTMQAMLLGSMSMDEVLSQWDAYWNE